MVEENWIFWPALFFFLTSLLQEHTTSPQKQNEPKQNQQQQQQIKYTDPSPPKRQLKHNRVFDSISANQMALYKIGVISKNSLMIKHCQWLDRVD